MLENVKRLTTGVLLLIEMNLIMNGFEEQISWQSYKHFTIKNYDSRVVIWANL